MGRSLTYPQLKALNPCKENSRNVARLLGGAKGWNGKRVSAAKFAKISTPRRGVHQTLADLTWVCSAIAQDDKDVERRLRFWVCDCGIRVLPIYEKVFPGDSRPRQAIIAAKQFARNPSSTARAAGAAWAAEAAWAAGAAWAAEAARAAWAARAARAAKAAGAAWAAEAAEEEWQLQRLVDWMGDPEPKALRFPRKKK